MKDKKTVVHHFQRRLDTIFNFLVAKEKGCLRFEYGRDWTRFMPEEQIEFIDKSYSISLDTKYSYLQRTNILIMQSEQLIKDQINAAKNKLPETVDS